MTDKKKIATYYNDVSQEMLEKYLQFQQNHPLKELQTDGTTVHYLRAGGGDKTILTFSGAHASPHSLFLTVPYLAADYNVMVVNSDGFKTLGALDRGINMALDKEGVKKVHIVGQSLAGIVGQLYFRANFSRVESLVLMATLAMKKPTKKSPVSLMLKLMPGALLRASMKKKFAAAFDNPDIPEQAQEMCRFRRAQLMDDMDNHFTKAKMLNAIKILSKFQKDSYELEDFQGWQGKTLVVSPEDDAGHDDLEFFKTHLPNVKTFVIPKGLGHIAPIVHYREILEMVKTFLKTGDVAAPFGLIR